MVVEKVKVLTTGWTETNSLMSELGAGEKRSYDDEEGRDIWKERTCVHMRDKSLYEVR